MKVKGSALKPGQTIAVWWSKPKQTPNQDIITSLVPYTGRLARLFPEGAQLAGFLLNRVGMTIDNREIYEVINGAA